MLGVAVSYLQWGREIDVVGSMGTSSENFHEEHVTFTLNRLIITDKEKCAEEIIKNAGRMILLLLCSAMMWQSPTLYMVRCTVPVFHERTKAFVSFPIYTDSGHARFIQHCWWSRSVHAGNRITQGRTGRRRAKRKATARTSRCWCGVSHASR